MNLPIFVSLSLATSLSLIILGSSETLGQDVSDQRTKVEESLSRLLIKPESKTPAAPVPVDSIVKSKLLVTIDKKEVKLRHKRGLVVEVHNASESPLVVEGDKASATIGSAHYQSLSFLTVDKTVSRPKPLPARMAIGTANVVAAGVTIGAVPTVRDAIIQAGPLKKRYGMDEKRREVDQANFGNRIVWPGDTTKGIIYFATHKKLRGASIELPVSAMYDSNNRSSITIVR